MNLSFTTSNSSSGRAWEMLMAPVELFTLLPCGCRLARLHSPKLAACCRWLCFGRRVGLDDPQRSLPTPTILWFCDSVIRWFCDSAILWFCDSVKAAIPCLQGESGSFPPNRTSSSVFRAQAHAVLEGLGWMCCIPSLKSKLWFAYFATCVAPALKEGSVHARRSGRLSSPADLHHFSLFFSRNQRKGQAWFASHIC